VVNGCHLSSTAMQDATTFDQRNDPTDLLKGATMSEHEAIERKTVRLLVEALKKEHKAFLPSDQPHYEEKMKKKTQVIVNGQVASTTIEIWDYSNNVDILLTALERIAKEDDHFLDAPVAREALAAYRKGKLNE